MLKFLKVFFITVVISVSVTGAEGEKIRDIEKVRKAIITINCRIPVSAYQNTGSWSGTGFLVDDQRGLLITNNHVAGRASVGTYFVTFYNGRQAEAKLVYYDQYADFAVMQIKQQDLPEEIEVIRFSDILPKLGADVFIVGNTEGRGFSFHSGYLSDLFEINGEMPQGSYIINMNSTGGASGSPVLNNENKAIGVLYGGGKTHALALKATYVEHILNELKNSGNLPGRKHIGVITELYSVDKAVKHRNFSKEEEKRYIKEFPDARNRVIAIRSILAGSPAAGILKSGDIIRAVNGKKVGADLTIFDLEMSNSKSDKIKVTIIRDGKQQEKEIKLYDLEKTKIDRIVDFAGGLFFEVDDYVAAKFGIPLGSVALVNAHTGSSFSSIPEMFTQDYKSVYRIQINSIGGASINSLSDLIAAVNSSIKKKYVKLDYVNFQPYFPEFNADRGFISSHDHLVQDITFDSIDSKPRILKYNFNNREWTSEGI